ncbi:MAG: CapA family protein [Deltaproteobacteria bacterium]|nr:CapA family protein [Deltaproteobacteria bacterium]
MRLLFVGDVMLGRLVNRELRRRPPEYPWGDTLPVFKEADLRFCNLECAVSDRGRPWSATPKAFHFRTDAGNIEALKAADINAVSLANNHTLDFGYEALEDTLEILDKAGIARAGAGKDIEEASSPAYLILSGKKIAFVAFTDNEPWWEAGQGQPGIFYVPVDTKDWRARLLFEKVKEAQRKADLVVVSAHWGPNWGYRPALEHIPFGHALVEAGAGVVFGHSCHVFQGIEVYKGSPIIYSSGDFIDDYAVAEIERNDESFIFSAEFEESRFTGMALIPTVITGFKAELAPSPRAELISAKMKNLCSEFNTSTEWPEDEKRLKILLGRG